MKLYIENLPLDSERKANKLIHICEERDLLEQGKCQETHVLTLPPVAWEMTSSISNFKKSLQSYHESQTHL